MELKYLKIIQDIKNRYPDSLPNYINGAEVFSATTEFLDVVCPIDGQKIVQVPMSTSADLEFLIKKIKPQQTIWAKLTLKKRVEIIYNYRQLLKQNEDLLARIIQVENGKCLSDAYDEITKAIETVEFSCALPNSINTKILEVSTNIYAYEEYRPVGITSCVTPFNFPVMVPHWTMAQTIALGNALIWKPSETTPITAMFIADLWKTAGLPDGIFNIIHGDRYLVENLCKHEAIKAISLVGSTTAAENVYHLATKVGKKVLALGGAKNYLIVSENCEPNSIVGDILSSAFGMGGQRCMAASVLVLIGNCEVVLSKILEKLNNYRLGPDFDYQVGLSPLTTKVVIEKISAYLEYARATGAKILVDGEKFSTPNRQGNYIGPSLIDWTGTEKAMQDTECFGPVLEVVKVKTMQDALELQNASKYGNAASIFTRSPREAMFFQKNFIAGMLGINIGVPVPREPLSFAGVNFSKFGTGEITGHGANLLWANLIKITTKWHQDQKQGWLS